MTKLSPFKNTETQTLTFTVLPRVNTFPLQKIRQIHENPWANMSSTNLIIKNIGTVIGGALIGGAATSAWKGVLTGVIGSFVFSEWKKDYPKEAIIASVAFAAIKFGIDHYLPGHELPSLCASFLPALALGDYATAGTVVTAWSGFVGSTYFPQIAFATVIAIEGLVSLFIGANLMDLGRGGNSVTKQELYALPAICALGIGGITYFYGYNPFTQAGLYAIPVQFGYLLEAWNPRRETTKTILKTIIPVYGIGLGVHLYYSPIQAIQYNVLYTVAVLFTSHVLYKQAARRQ